MPSAAVGGSPSATDGENFVVCLLSLCRVLGAHGELANSSSDYRRLSHGLTNVLVGVGSNG